MSDKVHAKLAKALTELGLLTADTIIVYPIRYDRTFLRLTASGIQLTYHDKRPDCLQCTTMHENLSHLPVALGGMIPDFDKSGKFQLVLLCEEDKEGLEAEAPVDAELQSSAVRMAMWMLLFLMRSRIVRECLLANPQKLFIVTSKGEVPTVHAGMGERMLSFLNSAPQPTEP